MPKRLFLGATVALVLGSLCPRYACAQTTIDRCASRITRASVVPCALQASPGIVVEQRGLDAIEGKRAAAARVLPSNPQVAVTIGRRQTDPGALEPSGTTWSASLGQEIEIGGQRSARVDAVDAERNAQTRRILAVRREIASGALAAYFDAIAAKQERALAEHLASLARALTILARSRADAGLASSVEADLADAASVRLAQLRLTSERRAQTSAAVLATLLGNDPMIATTPIDGDLDPLRIADADPSSLVPTALARRAELAIADAERTTQEKRAAALRRARIPNPTLSLFAESDRAGERVFGAGLSFPLGRPYGGEIAEAEALATRADADADRIKRRVLLEVATAVTNVQSRKAEVALFDAGRLSRADQALASIARELEARRLPLRDALIEQQALIELLQAAIEARRQLCLASTELARAAGIDLEQGAP